MTRGQLLVGAAWCGSLTATLALVIARYRSAMSGGIGYDLDTFLLPAARAIANGESPYDVHGYVYSPLVAVALSSFVDSGRELTFWTTATLISALIAVTAVTVTNWQRLNDWLRPAFFLVAGVTLFYNWPATLELWIGQTEFFVLALLTCAALATKSRMPWLSGAAIALAALVKSWPAVIGLWLFRQSAQQRLRSTIAAVLTVAVAVLITGVVLGPGELTRWLRAIADAADQDVEVFSVWGIGPKLFGGPEPGVLIDSIPARWILTIVLVMFVLFLLGACLVWPGDDDLSLWNIAACSILLLPVSHLVYFLLMLPILWTWFGRLLSPRGGQRSHELVVTGVLAVWWYVTFRHIWPGDSWTALSATGYSVIMLTTLTATSVSVGAEGQRHRRFQKISSDPTRSQSVS